MPATSLPPTPPRQHLAQPGAGIASPQQQYHPQYHPQQQQHQYQQHQQQHQQQQYQQQHQQYPNSSLTSSPFSSSYAVSSTTSPPPPQVPMRPQSVALHRSPHHHGPQPPPLPPKPSGHEDTSVGAAIAITGASWADDFPHVAAPQSPSGSSYPPIRLERRNPRFSTAATAGTTDRNDTARLTVSQIGPASTAYDISVHSPPPAPGYPSNTTSPYTGNANRKSVVPPPLPPYPNTNASPLSHDDRGERGPHPTPTHYQNNPGNSNNNNFNNPHHQPSAPQYPQYTSNVPHIQNSDHLVWTPKSPSNPLSSDGVSVHSPNAGGGSTVGRQHPVPPSPPPKTPRAAANAVRASMRMISNTGNSNLQQTHVQYSPTLTTPPPPSRPANPPPGRPASAAPSIPKSSPLVPRPTQFTENLSYQSPRASQSQRAQQLAGLDNLFLYENSSPTRALPGEDTRSPPPSSIANPTMITADRFGSGSGLKIEYDRRSRSVTNGRWEDLDGGLGSNITDPVSPGAVTSPSTATPPSSKGTQPVFRVLFDYVARREDEMSVRQNDFVRILYRTKDGWCMAESVDIDERSITRIRSVGIIPGNFIESYGTYRAPLRFG